MLVFDLETDGLLNDVTCIHCLVIYDSKSDQTFVYNDKGSEEPIVRGIQILEEADVICGHNVISYDIPVIEKIYPWFKCTSLVVDTLLLSRLYHANMMEVDKQLDNSRMPLQLRGRHSLESYGYRLGEYKGEFGKTTDWKEWSQEMQDYCIQDVNVTKKLCDHFHPYLSGSR
jgi:DNA polymerase elongation subunit (family B)